MVRKKKFSLMFLFIFFVTCFGISLDSTCKATDEDYQLTASQLNEICTITGASMVSGDVQVTFLNTFNQWARTMQARTDFDWFNYDIIFYPAGQNAINWVLNPSSNGSDLYITTLNTSTTSAYIYGFSNWNYDANNNVTGFTSKSIMRYAISYYSPNQITTSNFTNQTVTLTTNGFTITANSIGTYDVHSDTNKYIIWEPHIGKKGYTTIYGYNNTGLGYTSFRFTNTLGGGVTPTPTSTPTSVPTGGGGGGSVDLSTTNALISNLDDTISSGDTAIINELTEVPESGDFISISPQDILDTFFPLFNTIVSPFDDNIWRSLVNCLKDAIVAPYDGEPLILPFLGTDYELEPLQFDYPDDLVEFLTNMQWVLFILLVVLYYHKIYKLVTSGDFIDVVNKLSDIDIDHWLGGA